MTTLKVEELGLSTRSTNCLRRIGIETTDDLTNKSLSDLQAIPNFGASSALEVVVALNDLGLRLMPTPTIQALQERIRELETELAAIKET